jgi:RND superfamily putative drug exporter
MLPAAMKLLGDWNWYLPSWLEWLPRIGGEGDEPPPPAEPPTPDAVEEPRPAPVPA